MTRLPTSDALNEQTPLLAEEHREPNGNHHEHDYALPHHTDSNALHAQTPESHALPPATLPIAPARRIVIISALFALCVVLAVCATLVSTAMMQALEDIICRRVHGLGFPPNSTAPPDDNPCKDNAIMAEIAMITGWDGVFSCLPSLLLAVPFGAVADRYRRVLVVGLVLFSLTIQIAWVMFVCSADGALDVRLVWVANLTGMMSGGPVVFTSMMYTMLADISTDAQRTTIFLYVGSVIMGGSLVAHPITYQAMQVGTWFTFKVSLFLAAAGTVMAFSIPETLDKMAARKVDSVPIDTDPAPLNKPKPTELERMFSKSKTLLCTRCRLSAGCFGSRSLSASSLYRWRARSWARAPTTIRSSTSASDTMYPMPMPPSWRRSASLPSSSC